MPADLLPFSRGHRSQNCAKEVTAEFTNRRSELSPEDRAALDRLVDSFDQRPHTQGDTEFPGTTIGTIHARKRERVYVLYQQFNRDGQPRYLIKLWYCGVIVDGRMDFEARYNENSAG